jgi:hypothetical protein
MHGFAQRYYCYTVSYTLTLLACHFSVCESDQPLSTSTMLASVCAKVSNHCSLYTLLRTK